MQKNKYFGNLKKLLRRQAPANISPVNTFFSAQNLGGMAILGTAPVRCTAAWQRLASFVLFAMILEMVAFFAPYNTHIAQAQTVLPTVVMTNGAVLSEEEVDLLQQALVIVEHKIEESAVHEASATRTSVLSAPADITFTSVGTRTLTAYNSEAAQTDASPCITANGFNVCEWGVEDTVAANFLPFGTKVRIPELFGDRIFIVRDRMNERFSDRLDVWMVDKSDAIHFGVRRARIEIASPQ